MPEEVITCIKLAGTALTGLGSIILAWRIKEIVKWVSLSLNAHEISIDMLRKAFNGGSQEFPIVSGTVKHLNDVESKLGTKMLVAGFGCLGVGMVLNTIPAAWELIG